MICYMPFTQLEESHYKALTSAFGTITIYSPARFMVSDQMLQWAGQELLEIRHPAGLDGDALSALIREYKTWAGIHQGKIGEMAGFFKSRPERFVMMESTNPSQISHQVRHYGEPPGGDSPDPLREAALFLCFAQEFDAQQYIMDREMDAVQALEQEMMQRIAGDGADAGEDMEKTQFSSIPLRNQSLDPDMISQRVRAWSLLAQRDNASPWLYLTSSPSVFDHILELFGNGVEIYHQPLISIDDEPVVPPSRMQEIIQAMAADAEEQGVFMDRAGPGDARMHLTIYRLAGYGPQTFLEVLSGQATDVGAVERPPGGQARTLIGLVSGN